MEKIEVRKIFLKIGKKKEISLSLEEARELQQVLADMFGIENDDKVIVAPVLPIPYPVPVYPKRSPYRYWKTFITDNSTDAATGTTTVSSTKDYVITSCN